MAAYEHSVAALVMTPWAVGALFDVPWEQAGNPSAFEGWWELLILGVVLTGITGVMYWAAVSRLPVAGVGVIMFLEPASAVIWAALFLGETPGVASTIGVILVIGAGILAALEQRSPANRSSRYLAGDR